MLTISEEPTDPNHGWEPAKRPIKELLNYGLITARQDDRADEPRGGLVGEEAHGHRQGRAQRDPRPRGLGDAAHRPGEGDQGPRPPAPLPEGVCRDNADTLLRPAGGGRPGHRGVHRRDLPAPAAALVGQEGDPHEADLRAGDTGAEGEPLPPQVRLPGGHLHPEALLRHRRGPGGRRDDGRAAQDEGGPLDEKQGDSHPPRAGHRHPESGRTRGTKRSYARSSGRSSRASRAYARWS